jgi:predicted nucleotidyltransferase component of viral defense system
MRISRERLLSEAETTGFRPDVLEKAIYLLKLLEGLRSHPFLKGRLALKGGTALNLFVFDVPRLSVDIDLNYIGAMERETMIAERPKIEEAIQAVCLREGLAVRRVPVEHAGGKWSLRYESALVGGGNLDVDVNFMLRVPLWPVVICDSKPLGAYQSTNIPLLDINELAAGKLTALLTRRQARDLFDAHQLLKGGVLNQKRLRLAFVVYGAMSRLDWRSVSHEDIAFDERELEQRLMPVLHRDSEFHAVEPSQWAGRLVQECREALAVVLPFSQAELGFLGRLLDHGEIEPSLITRDASLVDKLKHHPMLLWKAVNVRKYKGKR